MTGALGVRAWPPHRSDGRAAAAAVGATEELDGAPPHKLRRIGACGAAPPRGGGSTCGALCDALQLSGSLPPRGPPEGAPRADACPGGQRHAGACLPSPKRERSPGAAALPLDPDGAVAGSAPPCWAPRAADAAPTAAPGRPAKLRRLAAVGCCAGSSGATAVAACAAPKAGGAAAGLQAQEAGAAAGAVAGARSCARLAAPAAARQPGGAADAGAVWRVAALPPAAVPAAAAPQPVPLQAGLPGAAAGGARRGKPARAARAPVASEAAGAGARPAAPARVAAASAARAGEARYPRRARGKADAPQHPGGLAPRASLPAGPRARQPRSSCDVPFEWEAGWGPAPRSGGGGAQRMEEHAGVRFIAPPEAGTFAAPPVVTWSGAAVERPGQARRPACPARPCLEPAHQSSRAKDSRQGCLAGGCGGSGATPAVRGAQPGGALRKHCMRGMPCLTRSQLWHAPVPPKPLCGASGAAPCGSADGLPRGPPGALCAGAAARRGAAARAAHGARGRARPAMAAGRPVRAGAGAPALWPSVQLCSLVRVVERA